MKDVCEYCQGQAWLDTHSGDDGLEIAQEPCHACHGTGFNYGLSRFNNFGEMPAKDPGVARRMLEECWDITYPNWKDGVWTHLVVIDDIKRRAQETLH